MMGGKKLGENMLPNEDQQEEWYWEQYTSYRYPCYSETDKEIHKLEQSKRSNELEWNSFHE